MLCWGCPWPLAFSSVRQRGSPLRLDGRIAAVPSHCSRPILPAPDRGGHPHLREDSAASANPSDVADLIALHAHPDNRWITGQYIHVDGASPDPSRNPGDA
jgi:NAD(P)-dependent dehydrogenase (short-subunit alcohol dehydrogenase family)